MLDNATAIQPWVDVSASAQPANQVVDVPFVHGVAEPAYESVVQTFAENFAQGELGASFSLVVGGKRVVDIWGGQVAPEGDAWCQDTLAVFFSCSKLLTTFVLHRLIADGLITLDAPLKQIWPELKAAQQGGTLRMALAHSLGLPAINQRLRPGAYNDHEYMVSVLEQQEPLWAPGSKVGYHPITFGFILGEIVRRLTGKTLGRCFSEYFAQPLGLDLHIGLPAKAFERVAPVQPWRPARGDVPGHVMQACQTIGSIQNLWLFNSGDWRLDGVNTLEGLRPEIPAANGVGNARSLAALLAIANDPDVLARVGLQADSVAGMNAVTSASHSDATLLCRSRFGLGTMKSMDNRDDPRADNFIIGRQAFGHVGMGGSYGICDTEAGFSAAYVMNQQGAGILLNERGQSLIDAVYRQLGYSGVRAGEWLP